MEFWEVIVDPNHWKFFFHIFILMFWCFFNIKLYRWNQHNWNPQIHGRKFSWRNPVSEKTCFFLMFWVVTGGKTSMDFFFTIPERGPPQKRKRATPWMNPGTGSGWIKGARISGFYNPNISHVTSRWNNPLILSMDPKFLAHPSKPLLSLKIFVRSNQLESPKIRGCRIQGSTLPLDWGTLGNMRED